MSDFETLYDEKLSSLQENEIVDDYFVSVLHSQDFVALLKGLYESSDETETSSIYLHCVEQGFRVCDLQRALCYLNDEWYDGPICFISDIDNVENVLTPDENIEQPQKPQPTYEKFYLHIQYISEEEVLVGDKNEIKIESNFFSTDAILQEGLSLLGLNKSGDNILHKECILNAPICETMPNIDAKSIEITEEYNFTYFSSEGEDVLGDLFYCIRDISNSLFETIDIENILRQMRQDISDLRDCFKAVLIERFITNKLIIEKCNQSGIYCVADFLIYKPSNISSMEVLEISQELQQIDTTMPIDIFNLWLGKLPPREYYVIKKRYLEGSLLTLESVGEVCNVSRERIRQVEQKAIRMLLSPKCNKYRRALTAQLKLLSPHKSYISISELVNLGLTVNMAIFLDRTIGDIVYDAGYKVCFFSMESKYRLDICLDELPNEFTQTELQEYSILVAEQLNGAYTSNEVVALIRNRYRTCGEYITKGRITLKIILSFLMQKYFPNGMDIYEEENIDFLRDKAREEFDGFELADNNRAIRARLQAFCVMADRGVWKYDTDQIVISKDLQAKIIEYIVAYNSPVLPIQAILDAFVDELHEIEIYNKYALHSQLKKFLSSEYSINRDYVMKSSGNTFYSVMEAYVKQSPFPVTKRDIQNNFPGATDIVIQQMAAATKVINMNGYYVHLDNLNITDDEIYAFKYAVDKELCDKQIHHANTVFNEIKSILSGLFNRIGVNHYLQFYYLLKELFPDDYEYNRPFIGALGVVIMNGEAQVINKILSTDECSIASIRQYARDVGTVIDRYIEFIDRNNDAFIFKNRETIISVSAAGLDDADFSKLDSILEEFMGDAQYKLLSEFYNYRALPELSCLWNTWLLYSVIKKYSNEFKLALTSNFLNEANPILIRQDFDEKLIDFEALEKTEQVDSEQFADSDDNILDSFDYEDLE